MNRNFVSLALSSLSLLGLYNPAQAANAPPDLTGIWQRVGYTAATTAERGQAPPLLPEAAKVYAQHKAAAAKGDKSHDLSTVCLPEGIPRLMLKSEPFEILHRPTLVAFVYQVNRLPRVVHLNEESTTDDSGYYLGSSVGKWQDDELVIETRNFNDLTLLDDAGLPQRPAAGARAHQRYRWRQATAQPHHHRRPGHVPYAVDHHGDLPASARLSDA